MAIIVTSNQTAEPKATEAKGSEAKEVKSSALEVNAPSEKKESEESDTPETEGKEETDEASDADDSVDESEAKDESEKDKPRNKKSGYQRRIDKLNARATAAQQEVEYWKQQALKGASGDKKDEPKVETSPKASTDKPQPDSFESHAEYVEALTDWKIEQRDKAKEAKANQAALEKEQTDLLSAYQKRVKTFMEKTPDFQEAFEGLKAPSPIVERLVFESEYGPEVAYALAQDEKEWARVNSLGPVAAALAIGKLAAKAEAQAEVHSKSSDEKPKNKTTQAPKPINPVGGKGGVVEKSLDEAAKSSQREYEAARRKQIEKRAASW